METYLPTSVPCPIEGNSIIEVSARIVITSLLKALSLVQSCLSLVARQLPTSVKRCNNNRFIVKFLINHALLFNNRFIMFTLKILIARASWLYMLRIIPQYHIAPFQIGSLPDVYEFEHHTIHKRSVNPTRRHHRKLLRNFEVFNSKLAVCSIFVHLVTDILIIR